jgi:HNH endonuclease
MNRQQWGLCDDEANRQQCDGISMNDPRPDSYYVARGFSVYYIANAVFNIVTTPMGYLRGIEEILGDMRTLSLMRPFHRYTNLHDFIRNISTDIVTDEIDLDDGECRFLRKFLRLYSVDCPEAALADAEAFWDFVSESDAFHAAMDELADEVFHVLFNDVGFLHRFNRLCADYIENSGFGENLKTARGTLKRVRIPVWARRAVFYRDKGECRSCKRSLAALINQLETERYDHIVPLACFGPNDLTNLQLLCEPCNLKKAASELPVSNLYLRAIAS